MNVLRRFAKRLTASVLGQRDDGRLQEELAEHLALLTEEYARAGLPLDEARRRARLRLGAVDATTESYRDEQRLRPLEDTWQDIRYALRALRGTPGFTTVALVVLTLGIGATTAIFSVVDAVVLRPLPFDEQDRLVAVGERRQPGPRDTNHDPRALLSIATPNYVDWIAEQRVFESMAGIVGAPFSSFTLNQPGEEPEDVPGLRVTAGFFDVLRIRPALGRAFTADNEIDGRHRVVVLSNALWQRRFGGNPNIVGRTIALDDGGYEVLGIMPPGVSWDVAHSGGSLRPSELLLPYVIPPRERLRDPDGGRVMIIKGIARLEPGVSLEQAQAQMDQIAAALEKMYPAWNRDNRAGVRPLREHLVGTTTKSWMLTLLGAVGITLLIACANVASLLLARASAREREVAVRAALGAGRLRLIRQLVVESLVLSSVGAAIALPAAWWAIQALRTAMPEGVPRVAAIALDLRVFVTAAGLALLTALLVGIVPALGVRPDLTSALRDGARAASAGRAALRLRSGLIVAEVALAVVLLVGAALFIGSFVALMRIDPGFSTDRVLTAQVAPRTPPGTRPSDALTALADIVEAVNRAPGVIHAALINGGLPLGRGNWSTDIAIPGREPGSADGVINARIVTRDYHRAMGIPLRRGRFFAATDRMGGEPVVIINDSAARTYFPGEDPIGRAVQISRDPLKIVGVVGDVHQAGLEADPRAEAYIPLSQVANMRGGGDLVIRTAGDPYDVLPAVRSIAMQVLPGTPLRTVTTMDELFARRTALRRLNMLLLGLFGFLSLVMAGVGLYGLLAYLVTQRTREIGVRMALGATRSTVIGMVLVQTSKLVAIGLATGGVGAWYLSASVKAFLFGLEPTDLRAFVWAFAAILAAALAASIVPARRAAAVDPVVALRAE
jgi:putative ABC transport system permease protein